MSSLAELIYYLREICGGVYIGLHFPVFPELRECTVTQWQVRLHLLRTIQEERVPGIWEIVLRTGVWQKSRQCERAERTWCVCLALQVRGVQRPEVRHWRCARLPLLSEHQTQPAAQLWPGCESHRPTERHQRQPGFLQLHCPIQWKVSHCGWGGLLPVGRLI